MAKANTLIYYTLDVILQGGKHTGSTFHNFLDLYELLDTMSEEYAVDIPTQAIVQKEAFRESLISHGQVIGDNINLVKIRMERIHFYDQVKGVTL